MPSSLPVELLRLILDNFACPPISNDGALKNPHRHELLSLCLTSKVFRQIAQPLLFAVIRLEEDEEDEKDTVRDLLQQLLETGNQNGMLTNVQKFSLVGTGLDDSTTMPTRLLTDLSEACTHLNQMICASCIIDLNSLAGSSE